MRNSFANEITRLADINKNIVLLSGDIGNRLFDNFKLKHSNRFYNCGIAEANIISMAAGLASVGLIPICYTITPFITARCFEQIKIDISYCNQPVIIVGTGSGLSYASLGATHHSLDDIAIMRTLPNMNILAPSDSLELKSCLEWSINSKKPIYMRIGKKGEENVFNEIPKFEIGKWKYIKNEGDVCILATGNMLPTAIKTSEKLALLNFKTRVVSCASLKPMDFDCLHAVFSECKFVASLEEHSIIGGFGSAIAEWKSQFNYHLSRHIIIGCSDTYNHIVGNQNDHRDAYGLTSDSIVKKISSYINI